MKAFLLSLFALILAVRLQADVWQPVSPQELAMKAPMVDPHADAEALFWDVRVKDEAQSNEYPHTVMQHYLRIKIFTDQGKEKFGTVDLTYFGKTRIGDILGRTIKPDGTVVELQKDSIFDKNIVRASGLKVKSKSFALPAVAPGVIIEYRWNEEHPDQLANYVRLPLQTNMPVERVTYHVKPLSSQWVPYHMTLRSFNCPTPKIESEAAGYGAFTVRNVPAFHEEEDMPPVDAVTQWVLLMYEPDRVGTEDQYWSDISRQMFNEYKSELKVNDDVRHIAETALQGAKTDDEKLLALAAYCRKNLKDVNGPDITLEERENAKRGNKNTAETLKRGEGTSHQINLAFAALATAAGYEARLARMADRGQMFFNKGSRTTYFLDAEDVAVNVNGQWKFFDIQDRDLPVGTLRWQEEGVQALIPDPKQPQWVTTPMTPAEKSQAGRLATFTLDQDGTLEGDVRVILSGHDAIAWRRLVREESAAARDQAIRSQLTQRFPDAHISDVQAHIPEDASKGAGYTYHIKIEGYAQKTGKRLFLTPAFFESGARARFPESKRDYPVYIHYPYSQFDSVRIRLPENYDLDHADAPAGINFGQSGSYTVKIAVTKDKTLIYERGLTMRATFIDTPNYPNLKHLFDEIHERDAHMVTLKVQGDTTAATPGSDK